MDHQESFVNYLKFEKRCSSHTVVAYQKDLDQFVDYSTIMIGEFNVKRVDTKLVRDWIVWMMEQSMSPRTVSRKVSALKSFYKYLMKQEVVDHNPAVNLPMPK